MQPLPMKWLAGDLGAALDHQHAACSGLGCSKCAAARIELIA
jgi:hypothetical protein